MFAQAVVEFFKYKVVGSIIVLSCCPPADRINLARQISQFGLSSTFSCDASILDHIDRHRLQGVLYMPGHDDKLFNKVKPLHFLTKYKWLIVGDRLPEALRKTRYDADVAFLERNTVDGHHGNATTFVSESPEIVHFHDAYVHPRDGVAVHPWAYWTAAEGLVVTHERERILRRQDLKKYPLRIATPVGHYSNKKYEGTFVDWLDDESISDQDPGIRCGYQTSLLLIERVNGQTYVLLVKLSDPLGAKCAMWQIVKTLRQTYSQTDGAVKADKAFQDVLIQNELWAAMINNNSMFVMLSTGDADLSGAILRILWDRIYVLDYIVAIWPFRVGFTYLAERESSTNMYLEPFSPAVWWACLAMMAVLALVQRITSKSRKEQDGALYTVLTTYLQQDASAVPEGASGRWAFIVLSVSAMLVHAYYTSAIVSALMSTGRGGPDSLKALADSKYSIGSEDYDYMRYLFFDVETTWDELEYLKKKKKTSKFYFELEKGVQMIQQGSMAFHSEYNQIYPHFKSFSDDHICKLQHVDTIPETLTWIISTKDGQWSSMLRIAGAWILETGLGKRLVGRLRIPQPPCRAALLAERVKLGDVAPLLLLTIFGAVLSLIILGIELMFAKTQRNRASMLSSDTKLDLETEDNMSSIMEYDID